MMQQMLSAVRFSAQVIINGLRCEDQFSRVRNCPLTEVI